MPRRRHQTPASVKAEDEESTTAKMPPPAAAKNPPRQPRPRRRVATVYDAVAGQVWPRKATGGGTAGRGHRATSRRRAIKHSTRQTPVAPDELLFRRKGAPERYAEFDVYRAHERHLPPGALPGSDLLKAIHVYASGFYGALSRQNRRRPSAREVDERSMDGSALLAFGILLEEAGRELLGRRGDLVFTEGAHGGDDDEPAWHDDLDAFPGYDDVEMSRDTSARASKRRKVVKEEDDDEPLVRDWPGPTHRAALLR